ncbi:hypothetical protein [Streptomyces sp. BPTC-684]|uniref:hypothetical protein n=1 Tax=Streptomyces sp. BPTC-684 TaxID=3043734 RepID=UPI0024B04938|nr:hypothetical protein [Streptomyces sp. BPTC-684]WHM40879.1 hypothetical protein QIY60_31035 [Streptomyces sp. BPTC-684]
MSQGRRDGRNKYFPLTAIDECTRLPMLRIYPQLDRATAIQFLDHVIQRLPFQVEVVQTNNGAECRKRIAQRLLAANKGWAPPA